MAEDKKLAGRPKGSPNKVTRDVKDNILAVFTRLGGTAAMARWAQNNQTEFYRLYARLIPLQVHSDVAHWVVRLPEPAPDAEAWQQQAQQTLSSHGSRILDHKPSS